MASQWTKYKIMHKDRHVATINSDGRCTIYYKSFMPYNLYLESGSDMDTRINNLQNFYHWCASRILTLDRKYAKEILGSIGAKQSYTDQDRAEISISYRCLSLTDVFWVDTVGKHSFADFNLYEHSLSNAFVDVSLKGRMLTAQNRELLGPRDYAGDTGTAGVAPKAWVRTEDGFVLLKDGDKDEVKAELLASRIARCFELDQVEYEPDYYDGEMVSKSRIITSLDQSIVPMEFIEIYLMNNDLDRDEFIEKHDAYSYYMMNIVDYLVGNTDRHWGNWGFYVDNTNNKVTKLYPLMDFNRSFLSYDTLEGARCQTTTENMSQLDAAIEAVRKVGLNQRSEVREEWFEDKDQYYMFLQRLELLKMATL